MDARAGSMNRKNTDVGESYTHYRKMATVVSELDLAAHQGHQLQTKITVHILSIRSQALFEIPGNGLHRLRAS